MKRFIPHTQVHEAVKELEAKKKLVKKEMDELGGKITRANNLGGAWTEQRHVMQTMANFQINRERKELSPYLKPQEVIQMLYGEEALFEYNATKDAIRKTYEDHPCSQGW
jgi:hypothetical protein